MSRPSYDLDADPHYQLGFIHSLVAEMIAAGQLDDHYAGRAQDWLDGLDRVGLAPPKDDGQ